MGFKLPKVDKLGADAAPFINLVVMSVTVSNATTPPPPPPGSSGNRLVGASGGDQGAETERPGDIVGTAEPVLSKSLLPLAGERIALDESRRGESPWGEIGAIAGHTVVMSAAVWPTLVDTDVEAASSLIFFKVD